MDRRQFLVAASAAGALAALPGRASAQAVSARPRGTKSIYLDAQGAPDGFDMKDGKPVPQQRLIDAIRERRIDVISMTVGDVGNGPDRFRNAVDQIAGYDQIIADNPTLFMRIDTAADFATARDTGRSGFIYNFQDTTPLEADASRVQTFATLGIRQFQLTYNKRNLAGDGCLERSNAGISDFGREVIAKVEEAKVLLDLSHSGQRTQAEGIAAARRPLAISHSGCRALVDNPRNTWDAEMKALADKGGVFGVYLMPFIRAKGQAQAEDLLRHIDHALNVCGEDHIGIGTDNPLMGYAINDETRKAQREFFEDRQKRGIAAPGEGPDIMNLVEGYNDVARYDRIAADLKRRGWSAARVDKLLGDNFVRLYSEVWS